MLGMIMMMAMTLTRSVTRLFSMPMLLMMVLLAGVGFVTMVMVSTDQGFSGRVLAEQFSIYQRASLRQQLSAKDVIVVVPVGATVG